MFVVLFFIPFLFTILKCDNELPEANDLNTYVDAIGGALYYLKSTYILHKPDTLVIRADNMRFAMVVTYVNLMKIEPKIDELPAYISSKVPGLLSYVTNLTTRTAFDIMSSQIQNKQFISLIGLEELWESTLENFKDLEQIRLGTEIEMETFEKPETPLREKINITNEAYYELCFNDLARNFYRKRHEQCNVDLRCLKLFTTKRNVRGLELSIWLYFFTYTWYSCQCYIFTPSRDKEIVHNICSTAYDEIMDLQKNNFPVIDTVMEKATLCTLLGYVQFLNRNWISSALQTVAKNGCFTKKKVFRRLYEEGMLKYEPKCSTNVTALAAAAMSLALRFILEKETAIPAPLGLNNSINSIESAVKYLESSSNLLNTDYNVVFGTFLTYMNFKQLAAKSTKLGNDIKMWVNQMHTKLNILLEKFLKKMPVQFLTVHPLFQDEKFWIQNLKELQNKKTKYKSRNVRLPTDAEVFAEVSDVTCTAALTHMPSQKGKDTTCKLPHSCLKQMTTAASTSSPVKTKLMSMLFTEFARNCFMFSRFRDSEMKKEWCSIAHGQVQYLVDKKIDALGYILELVVLCGHHGYAEFLDKNWISHILLHQNAVGCFVNKKQKEVTGLDYRRKAPRSLCDSKTTLYGTSLLSMALRYIVEMKY